ncbi:DNA polymerase III subunit epsilon [Rhodobacteraceae bacterium W635]|uniref:3'-5' exonuclease n=1 Tax=Nioella halotolerans TaxID=2303578 RepID=UPI000E3C726B|nr:DNA polymerase III subunit epsilon [Rhodobacteraceae bacterium W635]
MFTHLSLRLRIFLFFAFLALATSALAIAGLVLGYTRLGEDHALSAFVIAGVIAVAAILALTTWIWVLFDENVARPVERLAAEMRARAHAEVTHDIDHEAAKYLGDLGTAAAAVTRDLTETRNAMAMAVGRETARLGLEKSRLETLLAEVPLGVLFCAPDHTVVLYNARAVDILGASEALGLNRPLHHLLMPGPIRQAYDRLRTAGDGEGADILCATREDARLLEARMNLLSLEGQETDGPGYVLTLRDVSEDLGVHAERAALLERVITAATDALPDLPEGRRAALDATLSDVTTRKAATDTAWWPMEALPLGDLATALRARLARRDIGLAADLPARRIRCDGYAITRLLERLARGWSDLGATGVTLGAAHVGERAVTLSLGADVPAPDRATLDGWLAKPLSPGFAHFTGGDVQATHGTRVTLAHGGAALHLSLPLAFPRTTPPARAMQYDFDLLRAALPAELSEARLSQLNFVIFDTETTGLNPQVDEICQIAAVRVVNGRIRAEERFDMLVNPGRKIPAAATEVHHVTNEMVADAPDVATALTRFHRFADNNVLVAHNAPFDMAFLQRREAEIGQRFDQPILDTVLLSAILFGQSAEHTLDALCHRLAITIPEAERHTAIGDALATGEAFARMIPMMEAADLSTLGAVIKAFDRHARLIRHLN